MFRLLRAAAVAACLACQPVAMSATSVYLITRAGTLYRSSDAGASWQTVPIPGISRSNYTAALAIDPQNPLNLYVTFVELGGGGGAGKARVAATSPARSLFRSTDGGQNWSEIVLAANFTPSRLLADPASPGTLYAIAGSNLYRSSDSGDTFSMVVISPNRAVTSVIADGSQAGTVYAVVIDSSQGYVLYKSTDFGKTWTSLGAIAISSNRGRAAPNVTVDPRNGSTLYAASGAVICPTGTSNCSLLRSTDGGKTWASTGATGDLSYVAIDPRDGAVYASGTLTVPAQRGSATTGHVVKSVDGGKTWNAGDTGLPMNPLRLYIDPNATSTLYAAVDGSSAITQGPVGVYVSTNGGGAWTMSQVGPNAASDVVLGAEVSSGSPAAAPPPPPAAPTGSITRTVSAASLQEGPAAAESIVIATGTRLATGAATANYNRPPVTLGGTKVDVTDSAGVTRSAFLFKVSPTQVTYQVPPGTATGTGTVTVTAGDGLIATVKLEIAAVAPGIYTANSNGLAKGFVLRRSNGSVFIEDLFDIDGSGAVAARPITVSNGDEVRLIVYGTGFRGAADFSATMGGVAAAVLYAGPQLLQPGMDQFNLLIPPELGAGGQQSVPIAFTAAGQTANTVYIAVK